MELKLTYSKTQFEAAVKFISKHNKHFKGQKDYIRESLLETMHSLAVNPNTTYLGTMGFVLVPDRTFEDMDGDEYSCHIDINVDPSLGSEDYWNDDDLLEEIIKEPGENIWDK